MEDQTRITNAQGYLLGFIQADHPTAEQVSRWSGNKKRTKTNLALKGLIKWNGPDLVLTQAGEQALRIYALK